MRWTDELPIRWKLVLVTIFTAAIAELFAGAAITIYTTNDYRTQKTQEGVVQARVLAASLAAPLVFGDAAAGQEYLDALRPNEEITAAAAYGADGELFARYPRIGAPSELLQGAAPIGEPKFEGDKLMVSQPVTQTGKGVGTVYLVMSTDPLAARLANVGSLMILAALGSLLIAVPISMTLNADITKPIREIAAAARGVAAGDLGQKLTSSSRTDEIGVLVRVFGQMMTSLRDTMQLERLRALGQLSSGIAHDINNAITPVALYTDSLLEQEPNLSPRTRSYLEMVRRVIADVTMTVGRMKEFSRKREPEANLVPVDLNALIPQVVELTRARWGAIQQRQGGVIDLQTELAANLPGIMGVESEIRDALTNLIFNAVDAMPDGGMLMLRTKVLAMERVQVEVADTGAGMDEDTKRRCFEPFFTTKGEQGTGLGLAMVYGAVQRHGAEIEIESAVGKGTTVRLTFAARGPIVAAPLEAKTPVTAGSRSLRILIVDDDLSVLDSMRTVLELDEHVVVISSGGKAGIEEFNSAHAAGRPFAVVITDLGMPHVDGKQVANAVKATSPSTPVILLTGWGQQLIADEDAPPNVDHMMGKPPELEELRAVLARYA